MFSVTVTKEIIEFDKANVVFNVFIKKLYHKHE